MSTNKHQRKTLEESQIWLHKSSFVSKKQEFVFSFGSCNEVQCGQVGITKSAHRIRYLSNDLLMLRGRNTMSSSAETALQRPAMPDSLYYPHWVFFGSFLHVAKARGSGRLNCNWCYSTTTL